MHSILIRPLPLPRRAASLRLARQFAAAAAVALLGACADDHQELRSWMDQQRQSTPTVKETIAAPKKFEPFRYENAGRADPFSSSKLAVKVGAEPHGLTVWPIR